jgi:hypothetical protein
MYGGKVTDTLEANIPGPMLTKPDEGMDMIEGGPGNDTVTTDYDAESLKVKDLVECGPGRDTGYYEEGVGEAKNCEVRNPLPRNSQLLCE